MIDYDNSYHNCVQQYMHRRNLDHVYCVRVRAYMQQLAPPHKFLVNLCTCRLRNYVHRIYREKINLLPVHAPVTVDVGVPMFLLYQCAPNPFSSRFRLMMPAKYEFLFLIRLVSQLWNFSNADRAACSGTFFSMRQTPGSSPAASMWPVVLRFVRAY